MDLWHILVLIAVVTAPCFGLLCGESLSDWHDSSCYCNQTSDTIAYTGNEDYSSYRKNVLKPSINLTVIPETGEGFVTFLLPKKRCTHDKFEIELRLANASDDESCKTYNHSHHVGHLLLHSERQYSTFNLSATVTAGQWSECSDYAKVQFYYIIPGCYYVAIKPHINGHSKQPAESKPQYVYSMISKADVELMGRNTTVAVHYYPVKGTLVPRFSLGRPATSQAKSGPMLVSLELRSLVKLGEHACTRNSHEHDCCVMRDADRSSVCTKSKETNNCLKTSNDVECNFYNVPPGNYCVLFQILDDRCARSATVWSENKTNTEMECLWTYVHEVTKFNTLVPDVELKPDSIKWYVWLILGSVVTTIFACLMYGLFTLLTIYRRDDIENNTAGVTARHDNCLSPMLEHSKLLLLYARDCDAFMFLMSNFRETLVKYCNCEVLDVYDELYQQDIAIHGKNWLLAQMNESNNLKVVLVVTECAAAHQRAQIDRRQTVEYRDPDPCDKYFPLALKLLKEDVNSGLYNRIKLVEFQGFETGNEEDNLFPNPRTRYNLLSHFKDLVCEIQRGSSQDTVNMCDDDFKDLQSLLDDLLQYKKDNPSYLQSIIKTT